VTLSPNYPAAGNGEGFHKVAKGPIRSPTGREKITTEPPRRGGQRKGKKELVFIESPVRLKPRPTGTITRFSYCSTTWEKRGSGGRTTPSFKKTTTKNLSQHGNGVPLSAKTKDSMKAEMGQKDSTSRPMRRGATGHS